MTASRLIVDVWMQHPTLRFILEGLDGLGLDEETRSLYLHDNAQRVFGPWLNRSGTAGYGWEWRKE